MLDLKKEIKKCFADIIVDTDAAIDGTLNFDDKKYVISLGHDQYSKTAYYFNEPPHNIVIGDQILENVKINKEDETLLKHYVGSFMCHELSHSLWSDDVKTISSILKKLKIPFHYYNIFEDARIEEIYRNKCSRDFKWSFLEVFEPKEFTPLAVYFYAIFTENEKFKDRVDKEYSDGLKATPFYDDVMEYYHKTLPITNTVELLELIKEFYKKYKNETDEKNSPSPFEFEFTIGEGGKKSLEIVIDSTGESDVQERPGDKDKEKEKEMDTLSFSLTKKDREENQSFFSPTPNLDSKYIKRKGDEIFKFALKRIFKKKYETLLSERFSKKMSINKLVLDHDDIYVHKNIAKRGKTSEQHKKLALVLDMSGSMSTIKNDMAVVVYIFNKLAQYKLIDLSLFLTGGNRRAESFEVPMPIQEKDLFCLDFTGAIEGMESCFRVYEKKLRKAEIIFVLTDGMLVDKPINKETLHSKGIYTRAIYILPKHNSHYKKEITSKMTHYFDEFTMKETVEAIFEEIIMKYKKL